MPLIFILRFNSAFYNEKQEKELACDNKISLLFTNVKRYLIILL